MKASFLCLIIANISFFTHCLASPKLVLSPLMQEVERKKALYYFKKRSGVDKEGGAEDRWLMPSFKKYKFPFWGLPFGIYAKGADFAPPLFEEASFPTPQYQSPAASSYNQQPVTFPTPQYQYPGPSSYNQLPAGTTPGTIPYGSDTQQVYNYLKRSRNSPINNCPNGRRRRDGKCVTLRKFRTSTTTESPKFSDYEYEEALADEYI